MANVVYRNYDGQEIGEDDIGSFIDWKIKSLVCEGKSYNEAYEQLFNDYFFTGSFVDKDFLKKMKHYYAKK
jgi:hypothetical protein